MTSSIERLESETEGSRMRMSELLDELRGRISPGEVVDQVMDFASDGAAGDFVRTLGRQVRNNPLPCVLIGAGMAWLMLGNSSGTNGDVGRATRGARRAAGRATEAFGDAIDDVQERARRAGNAAAGAGADLAAEAGDAADRATAATANVTGRVSGAFSRAAARGQSAVGEVADRATSTLSSAGSAVSETAQRAAARAQDVAATATGAVRAAAATTSDAVRETTGRLRNGAGDAVGAVAETTSELAHRVGDATRAAGEASRRAGTTLADLFRDQPLIAAGLGLAIGALIGTALPSTEAEDRFVGETSDEVKARARAMAREQADKAKHVVEQTYEAAKESASGLASAVAENASEVAARAARAAQHEGFPVGTLRAEHHREGGQNAPNPGSKGQEGLTGSMTEKGGAQADRERDAIPHTGREGFGEGQEEEHSKSAGE